MVEVAEELALGLVAGAERLDHGPVSGGGQGNDIASAILVVGMPGHETFRLEPVEQGDHGGAVDLESGGCLLLGLRFVCLQQQQNPELATVDAERVELFVLEVLEIEEGPFEQVGQPAAEPRSQVSLVRHSASLLLG